MGARTELKKSDFSLKKPIKFKSILVLGLILCIQHLVRFFVYFKGFKKSNVN